MSDTSSTQDSSAQTGDASTADPSTGTQAATNTSGDASTSSTGTSTPATLEQVVESYEAALTDFNTKLATYQSAQSDLTASAQTVSGLKQQLDTLGAAEDAKFDAVKPYLPTT